MRSSPPPDTPEVIAAGREGRERARPRACRPDEPQCYVAIGRAGLLHPLSAFNAPRCAVCGSKLYNYCRTPHE